jgi:hypothetical protein
MKLDDDSAKTQEYNYSREFTEIIKPELRDFLYAEYTEIMSSSNERREEEFNEINDEPDEYIKKLYERIAFESWFCCFYTADENEYPAALILEAFGDKIGVFCGFERDEILNQYDRLNESLEIEYDIVCDKAKYSRRVEPQIIKDELQKRFGDFKINLCYSDDDMKYLPTPESIEILQEAFIKLSFYKEISLENEKEFRIIVSRKMNPKSFIGGSDKVSLMRLAFDPDMLKQVLIFDTDFQKFDAMLYPPGEKGYALGFDIADINKASNLFTDIIGGDCDSETLPYGASFYHSLTNFTKAKKEEELSYGE